MAEGNFGFWMEEKRNASHPKINTNTLHRKNELEHRTSNIEHRTPEE